MDKSDLKEPWNERNQIKSTAQWIWAENKKATRVWCRKTFGKLKELVCRAVGGIFAVARIMLIMA
jgi:hypothetical protein